MVWWFWILLGIGLLAMELAFPGGLFALFFGLSALLVGIITGVGFGVAAWLQWLLFSTLSIGALIVLRGPLRARFNLKGIQRPVDSLIGESGVVLEDVTSGGLGKVEIRGSSWSARSQEALSKGQRCRVDLIEGLTLWVHPE